MTFDIFNGYCGVYKGLNCARDDDITGSRLGSLGAGTVAKILYNEGNTTYTSVTRYFDAVAKAVTNRMRFQYGSARPPENYTSGPSSEVLSVDFVQGTAWEAAKGTMITFRWSDTGTLVNRNMTREQVLQQESIPLRLSVQPKEEGREDRESKVREKGRAAWQGQWADAERSSSGGSKRFSIQDNTEETNGVNAITQEVCHRT